jgi:O-antigen/teichoic acid export membrane protein
MSKKFLLLVTLAGFAGSASAYVGPGLGVGVFGAILGAILAVLLAIVGVVWYPLKRLLKRKRPPPGSQEGKEER